MLMITSKAETLFIQLNFAGMVQVDSSEEFGDEDFVIFVCVFVLEFVGESGACSNTFHSNDPPGFRCHHLLSKSMPNESHIIQLNI